jgi:dihydrofolate reductase
VKEGIAAAQNLPGADEIFIFGGGQIYTEALEQNLVDRMYLTLVKGDYGADTFFPEYEGLGFHVSEAEEREADGYTYTFLTLDKH